MRYNFAFSQFHESYVMEALKYARYMRRRGDEMNASNFISSE